MRELVINEATCSTTGEPVASCNCAGHAALNADRGDDWPSWTVTRTPTPAVPFPDCCNVQGRLCPRCEAEARRLQRRGYSSSEDAGLLVPVLNFASGDDGDERQEPELQPEIVADGYMAPPRLDFGAIVANRAKQRNKSQPQPGPDDDHYVVNADDDGLPLPVMTWT